MRGVVVHHQVNTHTLFDRDRLVDLGEELQELLVTMTAVALANDLPGRDIQGAEERGGAVAHVVVGSPLGLARGQWQDRLGSVEGLDLGFLVDAQHDRSFRRVEIQPHDIADPKGPPDPADRGLRQTGGCGHATRAQVGRVLGLGLQGFGDDLFHPFIGDGSWRTGSGFIGESVETAIEESLPPLSDGGHGDAEFGRDGGVGFPFGRGQHDLGAERQPLSGCRPTRPRGKLRPFVGGQSNGLEGPSEWHGYLLGAPYKTPGNRARDIKRIFNSGH